MEWNKIWIGFFVGASKVVNNPKRIVLLYFHQKRELLLLTLFLIFLVVVVVCFRFTPISSFFFKLYAFILLTSTLVPGMCIYLCAFHFIPNTCVWIYLNASNYINILFLNKFFSTVYFYL